MKLNLDFVLYNGKTRLKQWWKAVKGHFEEVQTAHNALEDVVEAEKSKLSTEITQRTNADMALSNRINSEVTDRTSADNLLQENISDEAAERVEADNAIKASIEQIKTKYLGEGSTVTFEWIGQPPNAKLTSVSSSEPVVFIDLSGMFKLDDIPCGTMTETQILLNYIEENPDGNIEFNGGMTYIVASFNPKTKQISVTESDTFVESSVTNNIWTFTAASYYCDVTMGTGGGYVLVAGSGSPYTGSATVDKENLEDKIEKNSQKISDEEAARSEADNALNEKLASSTTEHQIFIQCDGDHDELKLQAAIDNAPENSVIYPVGTCVITNDNAQIGIGGTGLESYRIILQIKENRVLDGRYCNSITFVNSNPQTKQIVFQLLANAKLKNIDFYEDEETVTQDTVNPSVIYNSNSNAYEVSNCKFVNLKDTYHTNKLIFLKGEGANIFKNNTITNCYLTPSRGQLARIEVSSTAPIEGNIFSGFTCYGNFDNTQLGISLSGIVCNNFFTNVNLSGRKISLSGNVFSNKFTYMTDVQYSLNGQINTNEFQIHDMNSGGGTFIDLGNSALFVENKIEFVRANADEQVLIETNGNSKISDNIVKVQTAGQNFTGIIATNQTQIHHNTITVPSSVINSEASNVFMGTIGAVITDNITNATSLGTFDDTCVVERNITAEVSA